MKIPKYHEFFNPLLGAMHALGGSATLAELDEEVVRSMKLPPEVAEIPHGEAGRTTEVQYRLAWARTYLKKYGLITNSSQGVWVLTPEGQVRKTVDGREVQRVVREQRQRNLLFATPLSVIDQQDSETEESLPTTYLDWSEHLRETILAMSPSAFERLCQRLLRESGFIQVEVTGRSGDGGIDGHGIVRLAGLLSFPIIFQAKKYRGSVGAPDIRNFRGAMVGRADKGLFMTTGTFTPAASAEATRDGAPPIDLIDGDALIAKLKELKLGVTTRMVEVTEVDEAWFAAL
ncbi:restriction endonuclease [Deinococcus deserti]|uniref:Putative Mrr restriction endonuclease n=1 Tax=Deinococcus deserti (strain DSM 17065 / CIP 109153 / LMG 22923 / VCD115) TaxID=546414 RepID=C1CX47_DEIDV|nr:restriction endonuclease [Deinococcus deserti]ACO46764.1 putative Mrr restriction endonuclease [Deinococcus deserti VCD115]